MQRRAIIMGSASVRPFGSPQMRGDMNMASQTIKRELRVAFSRNAQPMWFRVTKWVVFLSVTQWLYGTQWFWGWMAGGVLAGSTVHFVYRWKTQGWTRPGGGWRDLEAGQR